MRRLLQNKIIRNASWIVGCKIIQSFLSLIISMLTVRYLGPANYGLISYASSLVAFVIPISQLGLSKILVQETVQFPSEEKQIYGTSILLSLLSSIVCVIGVISFVCVINRGEKETIIVCCLYSTLLFFQALELIMYWFQAMYLSKYYAVISVIAYVVVSGYKLFLLVTHKSIYWFAISSSLDYCIISISLLIIYRTIRGDGLSFSWKIAKRMFAKSQHYIISSLMVTIFAQTDKIMLKMLISDTVTGYYATAVTCAGISSFVFSAIIDSARPSIFENQKRGLIQYEKSVSKLYCVIIYLSLIQCLGMTICAKPLIYILFGEAFAPATQILQLIVWYTTFSYLGTVRNIWMLAENKQKYLWIINLSGAVLNIILNYFMICFWEANGAALASLITQIFTNVIIGYIIVPIRKNNVLMFRGLNPMILKK